MRLKNRTVVENRKQFYDFIKYIIENIITFVISLKFEDIYDLVTTNSSSKEYRTRQQNNKLT